MKSVLPKLKLWCLTPLNVLTILRENDFWVIDDNVAKLEKYHRQFLRQIMHLPERTSIEAIYLLSGRLPIEMEIHKKQLTMFGNIIRSDCTERNLAIRQLSLKADNSNSWFAWIRSLLLKYSLQDAIDQLNSRLSKSEWRHCINRNIEKYWSLNFKLVFTTSANDKSSLKKLINT